MQEIAEIKNEIRRKIEERRRKWNPILTWLKYLFFSASSVFGGSIAVAVILFGILLTASSGILWKVVGLLITLVGIFLFFNFVIVNPIRFAMEDKELLFSIDERDVVEEVGKLLRREKGKYYGNLDISVVSDGTINLFSGVVSWKELEKLKVLANYDFSLSSYPNPIGANLRWSVYEELKDAGLICDGKIKERIAEKVKELRGEQ
jgi:hypothetical protein